MTPSARGMRAGILLALGLIIARRWVDIPGWLFAVVLGGWIGKDLILYPFVEGLRGRRGVQEAPVAGCRGVVVRELSPPGYIEVEGELWRAEVSDGKRSVAKGQWVG